MMIRNRTGSDPDHLAMRQLLPWFVNSSLGPEELEQVRQHLESCLRCREEVAELESLSVLVRTADHLPVSMESSLATLKVRIAAEQGPTSLADRLRRLEAWLLMAPERWRLSMAVPWVLAIALGTVLLLGISPGGSPESPVAATTSSGQPSFTVLADPEVETVRFWVRFQADANLGEVGDLLFGLGAEITAGPTTQGLYTVAVDLEAEGGNPLSLLDRLERSNVVASVVLVPGSPAAGP